MALGNQAKIKTTREGVNRPSPALSVEDQDADPR